MEEVPQELLHHLGVFLRGAQEVRVRMAERVPADVADAQLFRYRFDEHSRDRHWPVRLLAPFRPGAR